MVLASSRHIKHIADSPLWTCGCRQRPGLLLSVGTPKQPRGHPADGSPRSRDRCEQGISFETYPTRVERVLHIFQLARSATVPNVISSPSSPRPPPLPRHSHPSCHPSSSHRTGSSQAPRPEVVGLRLWFDRGSAPAAFGHQTSQGTGPGFTAPNSPTPQLLPTTLAIPPRCASYT